MECREGLAALKSPYDKTVYLFGGRNIMALNKLETFEPTSRRFAFLGFEGCSYAPGRFGHSMVAYRDQLVVYGGQTGRSTLVPKSQCLKDLLSYSIPDGRWTLRPQNKQQSYARRNHSAFLLNRFLVIFGGINDFGRSMNDTLVYDLEQDRWVCDVPVEGAVPPLSHCGGRACFYPQRHTEPLSRVSDLPAIDWGQSSQLIREEGFYLVGGVDAEGVASGEVFVLRCEGLAMKWIKISKRIKGSPPEPRHSLALTYFERENALVVVGGRNDRKKIVYSDVFLLTLDTLIWVNVKCQGNGCIGRADHHIVQDSGPLETRA